MRRFGSLLLAVLAAGTLRSATLSTDLGGPFNDIGVGTRPLGLGGAFTAVADDANAVEENPAGMAFFDPKDKEGTFTHTDLYNLSFLSRDFVAYAQADNGWGAIGLSLDRLSASLNPGQYSENAVAYSGAKQVLGFDKDDYPKLAVGWQLKYLMVDSDITLDSGLGSSGTANGYGIGLGALFKLRQNLSFGLELQDAYSTLSWATGTHELIPATPRLGMAYHVTDSSLFAAEVRGQDGSSGVVASSWHVGVEHWFLDGKKLQWGMLRNVALRLGYYDLLQNQDGGTMTGGASVQADTWQINYTYEYGLTSTNELGDTQRFGLGIKF